MTNNFFTINSRKADGRIHRSWSAKLIEDNEQYMEFVGEFSETVTHNDLGTIERGTISYEYYWKNRWYNVFRFQNSDGTLRNFYCNISQPPTISDNCLDYIDLDVDVLVQIDGNYRILDVDEYEANSKLFGYSNELRKEVEYSLKTLLKLINSRSFPFDFT